MKRMNCFVVRYCLWSRTNTRPGIENKEMSEMSTFFRVDACAASERCALLTNCQAEKDKSELKQSGIIPEDTSLDN